jgi:2-polyprenyl-3-methyl-5-hydroxy-6-metoxy-1,4-benzoquinol methylase
MNYEIVKNQEHGFRQVSPLPAVKVLEEFYNRNYYDAKGYSPKYTPDEIAFKLLMAREIEFLLPKKSGSFLDIGCGEGFVLDFFRNRGWNVTGLDFSHDGVFRHFPELAERVIKGDIFDSMAGLENASQKFDLIVCNNVLEHVLDPLGFLSKIRSLCHPDTLIRFQVPNDFSWFQDVLMNKNLVTKQYWVLPPGHLSYFNSDNLKAVLKSFDYQTVELLGTFPIELFLLNEKSNYSANPSVGPFAHQARVNFELSLFNSSIDNFISFRRGCGLSGVCRELIAYCKLT